jgi:hypothetical protein
MDFFESGLQSQGLTWLFTQLKSNVLPIIEINSNIKRYSKDQKKQGPIAK